MGSSSKAETLTPTADSSCFKKKLSCSEPDAGCCSSPSFLSTVSSKAGALDFLVFFFKSFFGASDGFRAFLGFLAAEGFTSVVDMFV